MLEEMMPRWVPTENVNGFEICPGLYRDEVRLHFSRQLILQCIQKGL